MVALHDTTLTLKDALALRKRSIRKENQLFLLEGIRELRVALAANWPLKLLFCCSSLYTGALDEQLHARHVPIHTLSARDFGRLAYREDSGGVIAVACTRPSMLRTADIGTKPLVLVLDGIEKPGNVGAIFRTAAATGVRAVLLCHSGDPYNANVIRNSLGSLFSVPWMQMDAQAAKAWIDQRQLQLLGLDPEGTLRYTDAKLDVGTALVLGAEAQGLDSFWKKSCHELLTLPLVTSAVDSLNVASTAAVVSYEAVRQRGLTLS